MFNTYQKISFYDETLQRPVTLSMVSNCDDDFACPLILMHDGQNLFEDEEAAYGRSWRLLSQIQDPSFPKVRVVGISNNQMGNGRLDEYSPFVCSDEFGINAGFGLEVGGKGDLYLKWIFDTIVPGLRDLIPFTDVYMGGSSMGGYISLVAALDYSDKLSGVFCMSNAWWFAYEPLVQRIRSFQGVLPKIYLDTGTKESKNAAIRRSYRDLHDAITAELRQKNPEVLISKMIKKGLHNEEAWEHRFSEIIHLLIP